MKRLFQAIGFVLFYTFVRTFTLLPLQFQYAVSDVFYLVIRLVGYRKKIVRSNLQKSFPKKNLAELATIERKFYRHLCDMLVESVAQIGFSTDRLMRLYRFRNPEILNQYAAEGKGVLLATAHYGNWEWFTSYPPQSPYLVLAIYKPLNNPYFDRFFKKLREKTGAKAFAMEEILRQIFYYREKKVPTLTYFLIDQRPVRKSIGYWTIFLNQETPFYIGIEKIARKTGFPVFFMKVDKISRGHYEAEFVLLAEEPEKTKEFEITEKHIRLLEEMIRQKPELWLWSHRRWKLKQRPEDTVVTNSLPKL